MNAARRVALLCALLGGVPAAAVGAPGLAQHDAEAKEAILASLREANDTFDAGRFAEALDRYDALAAQVELAEVHFRRGACLDRLGRPAEAAAAYRTYLALAPDARDAGRVRFDIERLDRAAAEASRVEPVVESRPPPAPPPSAGAPPAAADRDLRTPAWICGGGAGALALGAGVLGWLTASAIDEANGYDRRAPGHSRSGLEDLQDRARGLETAFWITGAAALVSGLGATTLFLLDRDPEAGGAHLGPGHLLVRF